MYLNQGLFNFRCVAIVVATFMLSLVSLSAKPKSERPNIILIMADDMGYECLGSYGSTYQTPVLDKAAQAGVRFEHCYSQPLCTPSRVKIMTGRYNSRNYDGFGYLNPKQVTFGNLLQDAGYKTCIAGKWQLSGDAEDIRKFGFDEHCLWNMLQYQKTGKDPGEKRDELARYRRPKLYRNGEWFSGDADDYGPSVNCDFILDFMEKNREEPFFVYYPMILTHSPFPATPDSSDWNEDAIEKRKGGKHFPDMVAFTDKIVGQIEQKVKDMGLYDNTIILFTGDNGTEKGMKTKMEAGQTIIGGKASMTDAGTRVPLIAWGGAITAGTATNTLVEFSDFFPTIMDIAQVPIPDTLPIDGKSFLPVLSKADYIHRDWTFCLFSGKAKPTPETPCFARTREYKLYRTGAFYHVAHDVKETDDLSKKSLSEQQLKIMKHLEELIRQHTIPAFSKNQ
jgi:arylsulfatase A